MKETMDIESANANITPSCPPLRALRWPTDKFSAKVHFIFLLIWFISGIHVIYFGYYIQEENQVSHYHNANHQQDFYGTSVIQPVSRKFSVRDIFTSLIIIQISSAIAYASIFLLKYYNKIFIYLSMMFFWLLILGLGLAMTSVVIFSVKQPLFVFFGVPIAFFLMMFIYIAININETRFNIIQRLLEDSCNVILQFPQLIMTSIVALMILTAFTFITYAICYYVGYIRGGLREFHIAFIMFGVLWNTFFIYDLYELIMSSAIYIWHKKMNQKDQTIGVLTMSLLYKNMTSSLRTYLGTASRGSSIIFPFTQLKNITCVKPSSLVLMVLIPLQIIPFWLPLRSWSYATTTLKGFDFKKSTEEVFKTVYQAPVHCLVLYVFSVMSLLFALGMPMGVATSVLGYMIDHDNELGRFFAIFYCISFIPFIVLIITLLTSIKSMLIYSVYDSLTSSE